VTLAYHHRNPEESPQRIAAKVWVARTTGLASHIKSGGKLLVRERLQVAPFHRSDGIQGHEMVCHVGYAGIRRVPSRRTTSLATIPATQKTHYQTNAFPPRCGNEVKSIRSRDQSAAGVDTVRDIGRFVGESNSLPVILIKKGATRVAQALKVTPEAPIKSRR